MQSMQNTVSEHEQYLDALRDFNDWLTSAKEELQRWSDLSGDTVSIKRKLSKVQVKNFLKSRLYIFITEDEYIFLPYLYYGSLP